MAEIKRIPTAKVYPFFQRLPAPPTPGLNALETALIVPVYQVVRAFDQTLEPIPSSRLSWFGRTVETENYDSRKGDGFFAAAGLESMVQGGALDAGSLRVHAIIGGGPERLEKSLNRAQEERVVLEASTATMDSVTDSGGPLANTSVRILTAPNADFPRALAGIPLPGTPQSGTNLNPLTDTYVEVRLAGGYRAQVLAVDEDNPTQLTVRMNLDIPDAHSGSATVVAFPRQFDPHPGGRQAEIALAGGNIASIVEGGVTYRNLSNRVVELVVTTAGQTPSVSVEIDSNDDVEVTIAAPGGTTVSQVRELLRSTAEFTQSGFPIVDISGSGTIDATTGTLNAAVAQDWAFIRTKDPRGDLNGRALSFVPNSPESPDTTVVAIGDDWQVNLGTDSGAIVATYADIGAALVAANAPLELVLADGTLPTAVPNQLFESRNRLGYQHWSAAGIPGLTVSQSASAVLRGGISGGGVLVYGGLLPKTAANISAALYAEYRALRVDLSAKASLARTGNRPNPVEVYEDTIEDVLGEISTLNPGALAALIHLSASGGRRVFVISPHEVSEAEPWGTVAATEEALRFCKRRDNYHIAVLNDAYWVPERVSTFARNLGGELSEGRPRPLKKALRLYIPTKNPDRAPDLPIVSGVDGTPDPIDGTVYTASTDFVGAGVEPGDVIVFSSFSQAPSAPIVLQDGRRGWEVSAVGSGGDSFAIQLGGSAPGTSVTGPFEIVRQGNMLRAADGSYDAAAAVTALNTWHRLFSQRRMARHHCDSFRYTARGISLTLDGVYALAGYMGLLANHTQHLPSTSLPYRNFRTVEGTHTLYEEDQLEILAGAGLTLPWQKAGNEEARVTVFRDVSADTSDRISQRRTAGVAEDMLARDIKSIMDRALGPNIVTDQWLDLISGQLGDLTERYTTKTPVFKRLSLVRVIPITDEIRQQFEIDDSGVLIVYRKQHYDEAAAAIVNLIVEPSQ